MKKNNSLVSLVFLCEALSDPLCLNKKIREDQKWIFINDLPLHNYNKLIFF